MRRDVAVASGPVASVPAVSAPAVAGGVPSPAEAAPPVTDALELALNAAFYRPTRWFAGPDGLPLPLPS